MGAFLLKRWINCRALSAAWLRKLGPSETLSERTFEHCVSPSAPGRRAPPGKSIAKQSVLGWVKKGTPRENGRPHRQNHATLASRTLERYRRHY
jgi:hypothetical protein